jgi:single-strand DNA-binding protein
MYQLITVLGNLGSNPEMRYTQQGIPVTTFSVAVNEKYGDKESVIWFRVSCWRQLAELTGQYLSKGRPVLITGRVQARAYTDRNGEPACSLDLTADTVKFLGARQESNGQAAPGERPQSAATHTEPLDEDIPF